MKTHTVKFNTDFSETGLTGFIGWKRLKELLETSGEIGKSENLNGFIINDDGIQLQLTYKKGKG